MLAVKYKIIINVWEIIVIEKLLNIVNVNIIIRAVINIKMLVTALFYMYSYYYYK